MKKPLNLRLLDYLAIGSLLWLGLLIYDAQANTDDLFIGYADIDGSDCEEPIWLSRVTDKTGNVRNNGRLHVRGISPTFGVPKNWEPKEIGAIQDTNNDNADDLHGYVMDKDGKKIEHTIYGKKCMQGSYTYRQPFGVLTNSDVVFEWRHHKKPCHLTVVTPLRRYVQVVGEAIERGDKTCKVSQHEVNTLEHGLLGGKYRALSGSVWSTWSSNVQSLVDSLKLVHRIPHF
jgi:hypothetical protein